MCVLMHKHRRRIPERAAVITGTLSGRAPAPEQGRRVRRKIRWRRRRRGREPGEAGRGARDFSRSRWRGWGGTRRTIPNRTTFPNTASNRTGGSVPSDGGVLPLGTGASRRAGRAAGTGLVHRAAGLSMTGSGKLGGNLSRGRKPIGQRDYSPIRRSRRRDFHRVGKSLRKTTGV